MVSVYRVVNIDYVMGVAHIVNLEAGHKKKVDVLYYLPNNLRKGI